MASKTKLLKDEYPKIYALVDRRKNKGVDLENLTYRSNQKIWWKCNKDPCGDCHLWFTTVNSVVRSPTNGCPFCSRRKVCLHDSLFSTHPKLMEEWDYEENKKLGFDPQTLASGSGKVVFWRCSKHKTCDQHKWQSRINHRTSGRNCPFCAKTGSKGLVCSCSSLTSQEPDLLDSWYWKKNNKLGIYPNKVSVGSDKIVYWKCSHHTTCSKHVWKEKIGVRKRGGCPFCSHQRCCRCDSFMNSFPELRKEFDVEKNNKINPYEISYGSDIKLWWKCEKGHSWRTKVNHRSSGNGHGCPICKESRLEKECRRLLTDLAGVYRFRFEEQKKFPDLIRKKTNGKLKFDFYVTGFQYDILIELDGEQHFEIVRFGGMENLDDTQERDKIKFKYCLDNNKHLIHISYSEMKNMEKHLINFFDLILDMQKLNIEHPATVFCGKEYEELKETIYYRDW